MSQRATALERQLRQDPLTRGSAVKALMEGEGNPVWTELRGPDGKVLEHAGGAGLDLGAAKRMVKSAMAAINQGQLGYALICGAKPK